jgi:alanyl-tRNA synthetase
LSLETRSEIEEVTNLAIRGDLAISSQFMSVAEAKTWGAVALFGETYDESVRVIQIGGPWSRELCGGTHVSRSSQVGLVSLIGESSVGSGSRRVEALVGIEAFRSLATERALVARLTDAFKAPREQLEERIYESIEELKAAQKKLASLQTSMLMEKIPQAISSAQMHGSSKLVNVELGAISDGGDLRALALDAVNRVGSETAVIVITAIADSKPVVAVATTDAARAAGLKAGDLVRTASQILGGGGGGKPDYAQGGGSDSTKRPDAILAIREALN